MSKGHGVIVDIPDEAALVTAELVIVSYVRDDGSAGYSVHTKGEAPMTTFLGLTVVAQDHLRDWGRA